MRKQCEYTIISPKGKKKPIKIPLEKNGNIAHLSKRKSQKVLLRMLFWYHQN